MRSRFPLLLTLCLALEAHADGFATYSEHAKLANHFVVDAGEVEKLTPPAGTTWDSDVLRLNNRCLKPSGYLGYWGYGNKAALLLVDSARTNELALLEDSVGSIKVELKLVIVVECPARALGADLQKLLEELKRRTIENQLLIEQLKQQNRRTQ